MTVKKLENNNPEVLKIKSKVIVATPEKLAVKELAQSVSEGMTEYKIILEDLLANLREGKHEYIKEE